MRNEGGRHGAGPPSGEVHSGEGGSACQKEVTGLPDGSGVGVQARGGRPPTAAQGRRVLTAGGTLAGGQ